MYISKRKKIKMASKIFINIIMSIFLFTLPNCVHAQKKWSLEMRPGISFATQNLGDTSIKTGFSFEETVVYRISKHISGYTSCSWNRFASNEYFTETKIDFEETDFCFGIQFKYSVEHTKINYIFKMGTTCSLVEVEHSNGKIIELYQQHAIGRQIGSGITIPLGKRWVLIPEVRYHSLLHKINVRESAPVYLNYFSSSVGLSIPLNL